MTTQYKIFGSGLKTLSVDEFFDYIKQHADSGNAHDLYSSVAWVHRAVQLRANALATIPYTLMRGETEIEDNDWPFDLAELLWTTEAQLCLFGACYWLKRRNRVTVRDVQILNPQSMEVVTDSTEGIVGFKQATSSGKPKSYDIDDIVYYRLFNPNDDLGPGVPPARVSKEVAQIIHHSNEWAGKFFENSAIPAVILETDYQIQEDEQKRLRAGWNRLLQGVKRAFRTLVLTGGLKANVIGQPVKDLAMPDLALSAKRQIATAFGIPLAMFEENAANRATAQVHRASFYTETIIPEAEMLARVLNDQFMRDLGYEFEWQVMGIEAIQREEAEKAASVRDMITAINDSHTRGLLGEREARGLISELLIQMGLPGLLELAQMELPDTPDDVGQMPALPQPSQEPQAEETIEEEKSIANEKQAGATSVGGRPDGYWSELARWRKVAEKDAKREFTSTILPASVMAAIKAVLESAGTEVAFRFLKQVDDARREYESELERRIMEVFDSYQDPSVRAVIDDALDAFPWDQHESDLRGAMSGTLANASMGESLRIGAEIGIGFDPALVNTEALAWAREHAGMRSKTLTETTRKQLRETLAWYIETPGVDQNDVVEKLTPALGRTRAEMIATTEITEAFAQASATSKRELSQMGYEATRIWNTAADDMVCPICGPMHGAPEKDWQPASGPPAHPRCRCTVSLSFRPVDELEGRFADLQREREEWMRDEG